MVFVPIATVRVQQKSRLRSPAPVPPPAHPKDAVLQCSANAAPPAARSGSPLPGFEGPSCSRPAADGPCIEESEPLTNNTTGHGPALAAKRVQRRQQGRLRRTKRTQ